ncbi:MAG TPA: biotin/lipoyl-containing protein, partial [Candidatus Binatia bacterium]|nr:biotin/lipoyl-containing protein [Candidatus Binatia bacterium]
MDVKLPQLAEGVESGTVVNILVSEGQEIKKDQAFMELETQKAVGSIPSPSSGTVTKVHVKEGMEVSVGQVLISIESGSKTAASEAKNSAPSPSSNRAQPNVAPAPRARTAAEPEAGRKPAETFHYHSSAGMAPPAPPSVRRIAHELGIDLTRVRGSEAGGRIRMADVRAYIQQLQELQQPQGSGQSAPAALREVIDFSKWGPIRREKLSPLRRTVSRRMLESWTTIP